MLTASRPSTRRCRKPPEQIGRPVPWMEPPSPAVPGAMPGPPALPMRRYCLLAASIDRGTSNVPGRSRGTGNPPHRDGAPDRIRTCDLWLRRPTLYPTELRAPELTGSDARRIAFRGAANERDAMVLHHRSSKQVSVRPTPWRVRPGVPMDRSTRFDDGTLVDPGAGRQAASRWKRSAADPHDVRPHDDTGLSRPGAFCNHTRVYAKRFRRLP